MNTLLPLFIEHHVNHLSVAAEQRGLNAKYFGPLLLFALADLTPLIIEGWFHDIGAHSHAQANKCLALLRVCIERARDWQLFLGDNPASRVKKYPGNERDRFVTPEEMPRLMKALHREHEPTQIYFLLCLLTGCRRNEALDMKWTDLNFESRVWRKAHTKTRRPQLVTIPVTLLQRIAALPRLKDRHLHENPWVFATSSKRGHWCHALAFQRWEAIRKAAGLPDVTIHDLRRTTASWLAIHGENMAVVKDVLNHTTLANTSIYARLNASPVTRALEENSVRMLGGAHV
jgi:integrase